MSDRKRIYFDTETTSLKSPRLIELGFSIDSKVSGFRVKNPVPIEIDSEEVNGISEDSLVHLPFFQERPDYQDIKKMFEEGVVIAHNAPFDIEVLKNEGIHVTSYVDTKRVAMHLYPDLPRHRLQYLRVYLKVSLSQEERVAHTAEGDVRVLMAIFEKMLERIAAKHTDSDPFEKAIELSHVPVLIQKISFGKHIGKTFAEINRTDRNYMEFLWKKVAPEKGEDFQHTINYWMKLKSV